MSASRVACASFNLGTNTTITITRDSSAYTHTLKYSFNGATGTIVTKTNQASYVWSPPENTFYSKIPNTTSGYGIITCETYDGDTLVGTSTCGFYAYAVRANSAPTVNGTIVDTNPATIAVTGNSSALVRYLSKPQATLTASANKSATIKTIQIENPVGLVTTASPYVFDTVYSNEFRFKATDSRGYSTVKVLPVENWVEYDPCHFGSTPVVARTESTSTTAKVNADGFCYNGSFGSADNELTVEYTCKAIDGSFETAGTLTPIWYSDGAFVVTGEIEGLSLDKTFSIEFTVKDKLTAFSDTVILGQSVGDIRIGKDYVQFKNDVIVGDIENTLWKCFKARRKLNGNIYSGNLGVGLDSGEDYVRGVTALELYENENQKARLELRSDSHLYNDMNGMSFAEIISSIPTIENEHRGHFLLNGGDSVSPVLVQWGVVFKVPNGANIPTPINIQFNSGFTGRPQVFAGALHTLSETLDVATGTPTASEVTLYIKRASTTSTGVFWIAIGNGSNQVEKKGGVIK